MNALGVFFDWGEQVVVAATGNAAVDSGIEDLRMILPLPMAIDATACLACRCRRAKQRLPKVSVHPVVAAPRAGTGARSCGETRPAGRHWHGHRNPLPVTPRPQRPTNSSHSRSDFAGSGARAEARQIPCDDTRHCPRLDPGRAILWAYLGFCGYRPAAASLFAVTLRCGAGLPAYLLAVVGNRGSPSSGSAGYANSSRNCAEMLEFRRR